MQPTFEPAQIARYELEVVIEAARSAVWDALTAGTNLWWLPAFHMTGEGSVVSFDPRAGGQLIERHPGGASLLWYTVHMATPGESLHLVGHVAPDWGGPATSMLRLQLVERGAATALEVSDALYGRVSAEQAASLRAGWTELFTDGLKRHVEAGS